MSGSDSFSNGKRFGRDLYRIRIDRDVSLDDLYEATKVSPDLLKKFEDDALLDHPLFTDIYLRYLLKQVANILDIDPDVVLEAYEQDKKGEYTNQLAARYLDEDSRPVSDSTSSEKDEVETVEEEEEVKEETQSVDEADSNQAELEGGQENDDNKVSGSQRSRKGFFNWRKSVTLVIGLLVLVGMSLLITTQGVDEPVQTMTVEFAPPEIPQDTSDVDEPTEERSDQEPPVENSSEQTTMETLDSMRVDVIATDTGVDPIRIRVDDDLRRPYWIDESDSVSFYFKDSIVIEERLDKVEVQVEGEAYPFDNSDVDGSVTITRDEIEDSLNGPAEGVAANSNG